MPAAQSLFPHASTLYTIMGDGLLLVFLKCPWLFVRKRRSGQICQLRVFLLYKYTNVSILGLWRAAPCLPGPLPLGKHGAGEHLPSANSASRQLRPVRTSCASMCLLADRLPAPRAGLIDFTVLLFGCGYALRRSACGTDRPHIPIIRVQKIKGRS